MTPPPSDSPESLTVERERARIDEIDRAIVGLIKERRSASHAVQEARIHSGGRRTDTARETEIIRHFSLPLGKPGVTLAMTLLEICRGPVPVVGVGTTKL